uniref:Uncharacterized protein n=1 Tax=Leersia perrieri TaxID=77586 RepID=A0A0D9WLU2_9ORYZ
MEDAQENHPVDLQTKQIYAMKLKMKIKALMVSNAALNVIINIRTNKKENKRISVGQLYISDEDDLSKQNPNSVKSHINSSHPLVAPYISHKPVCPTDEERKRLNYPDRINHLTCPKLSLARTIYESKAVIASNPSESGRGLQLPIYPTIRPRHSNKRGRHPEYNSRSFGSPAFLPSSIRFSKNKIKSSVRLVRNFASLRLAVRRTYLPPTTPMLAAGHRATAIRRFPPGCGRHHRPTHPPAPSTTTTTAAASLLRPPHAWTKTTSLPRQPLLAVETDGRSDRGEGNGSVAGIERPPAEVELVRRASAVRRYPPGCGRGSAAAVPSVGVSAGEGGAKPSEEQSGLCNGDEKGSDGDQKVVVDADSNGGMDCGGDSGGGAEEEEEEGGGGRPGLMLPPSLPWAQHGRRSQRRKLP